MTNNKNKISTGGVVIHDDDEFTADRDQVLKRMMARDVVQHDNSHLGGIDAQSTRVPYWSELYQEENEIRRPAYYSDFSNKNQKLYKGSIELVILPSWGVIFPPYNIARLTGLLRYYDYEVKVSDININAYRYFNSHSGYDTNWWDSNKTHYWVEENYWTYIHEDLKPVLDKYIKSIVSRKPALVGLSLYTTNLQPSLYFMHQLKVKLPNVKIVIGGPGCFQTDVLDSEHRWYKKKNKIDIDLFDYTITGEGEQELLTLMENYKTDEMKSGSILGGFNSNLDLNNLPFPDYSDYDLSWYDYSDGVSLETSRGCVAKCTFCSETHFWKYRWRETNRVVEEMKYQYDRYGTRRFWFVDSLVNGNFKEFKSLVEGIIESGMKIRWNSYARCDGRMDLEFFKKLKQSGCMSLSFGLESGSQRVLDSMKKNVKIEEMISNLRDSRIADVNCHGNWIVGFPSEHNVDAAHSLQFLWNIRDDLYAISPGFGCGIAQFSDIEVNGYKNYKIIPDVCLENEWYTEDFKNTILHRSLRIKFMAIFMDLIKNQNSYIVNTQAYKNIKNFYTIEFTDNNPPLDFVEQTDANFDYFSNPQNDIEKLKFGIVNEYISFAWAIYSIFGAYSLTMEFNKEKDFAEFGPSLTHDYSAKVNIIIDTEGNMCLTLLHSYTESKEWEDYHNLNWDHESVIIEKNIKEFLTNEN